MLHLTHLHRSEMTCFPPSGSRLLENWIRGHGIADDAVRADEESVRARLDSSHCVAVAATDYDDVRVPDQRLLVAIAA